MTQNASPTTQTLKSSESSHHHQQTVLEEEKRKSYNNKILKHKKRKKKTHLNQSPDPSVRQCNTVIASITTTNGVDKCEVRKCDEVEKVLNMCNGPQANVSLSKRLLRGKEHCFDLGFRFIRFISSYLIHCYMN